MLLRSVLFLTLTWSLVSSDEGFPDGMTREEYIADRYQAIDAKYKRNVKVRVPITSDLLGKELELKVDQERQSIPLGTALVASKISDCWLAGGDGDDGSGDSYCGFARKYFNLGVTENAMKWRSYEYTYNQFNDYEVKQMFNWCLQKGWIIRGHCLFWDVDNPTNFPDWVYSSYGQEMVDHIHHRIDYAVPQFMEAERKVIHWDVNNEMLHGSFFQDRTGDPDIRQKMFQWADQKAKEIDSNHQIKWFVNDYNVLAGDETDKYVNQIQDLISKGAPITGIGLQSHYQNRDVNVQELNSKLDQLGALGLPLWITEFDWDGDTQGGAHTKHAQMLEQFYLTAIAHPNVEGILMWGYWDQAHWRPNAAICSGNDHDIYPNAAGEKYISIYQSKLQTHITEKPTLSVDEETGEPVWEFNFRAFKGEYEFQLMDSSTQERTNVVSHKVEVEDDMVYEF